MDLDKILSIYIDMLTMDTDVILCNILHGILICRISACIYFAGQAITQTTLDDNIFFVVFGAVD